MTKAADKVQNDTPHISGPVPVPSVEESVSDHEDSTLTSTTQQPVDKIEIDESVKNTFSGPDSSTKSQMYTQVDKEQAPEDIEDKMEIPEHKKLIFAAAGVIVILLILILTLILYVTVHWFRQNRAGVFHVETEVPHYEHVYDEPKDVDRRLLYHFYYDHNAPLLPPRQHLGPSVPPRPVGYYSVAYETERR